MQYLFSSDTYAKRRKSLAEKVGHGIILIAGNGNSPINYKDNYYPYRQDSNFLYFGGLDMPGLNMVIDCATGESTLYGNEVTIDHTVWMGPQPTLAELAKRTGFEHVRPSGELLGSCRGADVACLQPYRTEHFKLYQKMTEHGDCSVRPSEELIMAVIRPRPGQTIRASMFPCWCGHRYCRNLAAWGFVSLLPMWQQQWRKSLLVIVRAPAFWRPSDSVIFDNPLSREG